MDITPLLTTFSLIALAEFGDKTQLTVIALSAGYDRVKVFTGVILAFTLVTALGVLAGDVLLRMVAPDLLKIIAGLIFVAFGIMALLKKESCETENASPLGNILFSTFSMIAFAEMGDKTQLSAITLAARYDSPYLVFAGSILALALISLIGIFIGKRLCQTVPLSKIRMGAGAIFILFGVSFLAGF